MTMAFPAGVADRLECFLQAAQRFAHRLDDWNEVIFGEKRRHFTDRDELELLSAKIGMVHAGAQLQAIAARSGVPTAATSRS